MGLCRVPEPALQDLVASGVASGRLSGSTSYDRVQESDVVLVTVGTPLSDSFDADLSAIKSVFESYRNIAAMAKL